MSILLIEVDDRVTFIRDGRRHSTNCTIYIHWTIPAKCRYTAVKSQQTIDREMREWDFAAKITRMYTQYSLHIIHNVHTKYIIHSIHKVYTKYTQTIHKVYT